MQNAKSKTQKAKRKKPRPGFEFGSPIPFPTTITVTLTVHSEALQISYDCINVKKNVLKIGFFDITTMQIHIKINKRLETYYSHLLKKKFVQTRF